MKLVLIFTTIFFIPSVMNGNLALSRNKMSRRKDSHLAEKIDVDDIRQGIEELKEWTQNNSRMTEMPQISTSFERYNEDQRNTTITPNLDVDGTANNGGHDYYMLAAVLLAAIGYSRYFITYCKNKNWKKPSQEPSERSSTAPPVVEYQPQENQEERLVGVDVNADTIRNILYLISQINTGTSASTTGKSESQFGNSIDNSSENDEPPSYEETMVVNIESSLITCNSTAIVTEESAESGFRNSMSSSSENENDSDKTDWLRLYDEALGITVV